MRNAKRTCLIHAPPPAHPFFRYSQCPTAQPTSSLLRREQTNSAFCRAAPRDRRPVWAAEAGCTTTSRSSQTLFRLIGKVFLHFPNPMPLRLFEDKSTTATGWIGYRRSRVRVNGRSRFAPIFLRPRNLTAASLRSERATCNVLSNSSTGRRRYPDETTAPDAARKSRLG
jgi:hypothetical protein